MPTPRARAITAEIAETEASMAAVNDATAHKTPGQLAYEEDCAVYPTYSDGTPRRTWHKLDDVARFSWERAPRPRWKKGIAS